MTRLPSGYREVKLGEFAVCATCGGLIFDVSLEVHEAAHRRAGIVSASAAEVNRLGIDFQPGQRWIKAPGERQRRLAARRRAAAERRRAAR